MTTTAHTEFHTGQRVTRTFDGKIGTVESVTPYEHEADDVTEASRLAIAVRLDDDGEVWSGTEHAWVPVDEATHTQAQPFMRINTPHPCADAGRHAPQVVPVVGNADRGTHVFVVQHGRDYLTLAGELTSTPVWLTWPEAELAEQAHADTVGAL